MDQDREHILVVEDEQHLAVGIRYNLEAEGYRVTTADDGPAAVKIVESSPEPISLIILDLMLPGMSGYAVCQAIRESGGRMPILILSARTLTEDRTRGFDVGADQYLTKPFDLDELLSRVKNLLARDAARRQDQPPPLENGGLVAIGSATVDFDKHEVQTEAGAVRLTALELKLLQYFVNNEGRVISRQELLQNVWEMPKQLATRAPDQFIRRLRKTFEDDPAKPRHFLTVRDAGYRFVAATAEGD